jgi:hypothetical protein
MTTVARVFLESIRYNIEEKTLEEIKNNFDTKYAAICHLTDTVASDEHKTANWARVEKALSELFSSEISIVTRNALNKIDQKDCKLLEYYLAKRVDLSPKAIAMYRESSLELVRCLPDPNQNESFDIRGMIVGQVQSGKTGHFISTLCRTSSAGFHLTIIMAGMLDDLRQQTANRIWKALRNGPQSPYIINTDTDFQGPLQLNRDHQYITIVKKNVNILERLLSQMTLNRDDLKSVLVIDDESDQASLNGNAYDPTIEPTALCANET